MTLGEKISILRKKNNLSQLELAKEIGVSREYECNDITPTVDRAKKMALRVKEIPLLSEKDMDKILSIVDAFIRDTKAKQSFGLAK
ncbi:MAG: hypothetical protein A2W91_12865 [Bacteroidetes bacterium GWF2_38_335]|nr:MAG: hypothetical protein A2W91_12865 [Bacteroidetes bacterium GWF2_38_335]HBS86917.1 hypothetical protein [Bacteroidales bacterium]